MVATWLQIAVNVSYIYAMDRLRNNLLLQNLLNFGHMPVCSYLGPVVRTWVKFNPELGEILTQN